VLNGNVAFSKPRETPDKRENKSMFVVAHRDRSGDKRIEDVNS